MIIAKLIHPKLGVCAQEVIRTGMSLWEISNRWSSRYGKQFERCEIVTEGEPDGKNDFMPRLIENIRTGDIYHSKQEAAEVLGVNVETIRLHLARKFIHKHTPYLVRYHKGLTEFEKP